MDSGLVTVMDFDTANFAWSRYDAVVSIEDVHTSRRLRVPPGAGVDQLVLQFDDLDYDDGIRVVATAAHIDEALVFSRRHEAGRLLIHCQAGMCRSPAIALAIIAERMGAGMENEAVAEILRIRPIAAVNLLALQLADRALGRDGLLEAAWHSYEVGEDRIARIRFLRRVAGERFDPSSVR